MTEPWQPFDAEGRRKYLIMEEQLAMMAAAQEAPLEDWALTMMLLLTGCRLSEALALKLHHIDAHARYVVFRTLKRRKRHFRTVPVPAHVYSVVRGAMALSGRAEESQIWTISRTTAWRRVKRIMRSVGIAEGPHASPKGFRHGFAIGAISGGVPLPTVQKWMGHASIETTALYLDVAGEEERALARCFWERLELRL